MQQDVPMGRVACEPNSLAPGSAAASAATGQRSHAASVPAGVRGRTRAPSFADHSSQAQMFFHSQTPTEQAHLAAALVLELSKVETPAVRERMVGHLRVIDAGLAQAVAAGLALSPLPPAATPARAPHTPPISPALSILAQAQPSLQARRVGVLLTMAAMPTRCTSCTSCARPWPRRAHASP